MGIDAAARLTGVLNAALREAGESLASATVRYALRVAVLRQDPLGEFWLRMELEGTTSVREDWAREVHARLVALVGAEKAKAQREVERDAYTHRRTFEQNGKLLVLARGIAELEGQNRSLQAAYDDPVTPGMTPLDTGLAAINRDKARATLTPTLLYQQAIIERVKQAAFTYLLEAEAELLRGQVLPNVIAQGYAFVDAELLLRAPAASDALSSATERVAQGDKEAMSHATTSCRRAIKALADTLYPATEPVVDDAGVERSLDDAHYRNRLIEYVRAKRGRSTHADVLASNIASLSTRLKSLDDLASKGVHDSVSRAEAESCVSWTYILAADLLRVEQEASQSTTVAGQT